MGTKRTVFLSCCVLLMAALIGSGHISAQGQTKVTLFSVALDAGESGVVEGYIDCAVEQCAAFAITIHFDPAIVQVDRAEVGPYLGDRAFEAENVVDNETGEIRLAEIGRAHV